MLVEDKFEDLIFWQRARDLAKIVSIATKDVPLKKHYELAAQMERYAMAVLTDIAEGSTCDQKDDYVNFLYSAVGAAAGLRSYLFLAVDLGAISQGQFTDLSARIVEVTHLIDAYASRLQEGRRANPRHHRPS